MNTQSILKVFSVALLLSSVIPAFGMFSTLRTGFSTLAGRAKAGMQSAWARPTMRYGTMVALGGATAWGAQTACAKERERMVPAPKTSIKVSMIARIDENPRGSYEILEKELAATDNTNIMNLLFTYPNPAKAENNNKIFWFTGGTISLGLRGDNCLFRAQPNEKCHVKFEYNFTPDYTHPASNQKASNLLKHRQELERCMVSPEGKRCKKVFRAVNIQPNKGVKFEKFKINDFEKDDIHLMVPTASGNHKVIGIVSKPEC